MVRLPESYTIEQRFVTSSRGCDVSACEVLTYSSKYQVEVRTATMKCGTMYRRLSNLRRFLHQTLL